MPGSTLHRSGPSRVTPSPTESAPAVSPLIQRGPGVSDQQVGQGVALRSTSCRLRTRLGIFALETAPPGPLLSTHSCFPVVSVIVSIVIVGPAQSQAGRGGGLLIRQKRTHQLTSDFPQSALGHRKNTEQHVVGTSCKAASEEKLP